MTTRREFLQFSTAAIPAFSLGLPILEFQKPNLKVFCLDHGGDSSYIIAETPEQVKHWWFTELSGEEVPKKAEVTEISPDTIIRQGIENLEDISEEDKKHYLHYQISFKEGQGRCIEPPPIKWDYELYKILKISPLQLLQIVDTCTSKLTCRISFYVEKPAAMFIKDAIENKYPLPCCFCTTAG